jgi:methionyl-tRNA synthetase
MGHAHTLLVSEILSNILAAHGRILLSTGIDVHGTKIRKFAESTNQTVPALITQLEKSWESNIHRLIKYPFFWVNTEDRVHQRIVCWAFNQLCKRGFIHEGFYEGWYDIQDEMFIDQQTPGAIWVSEKTLFFKFGSLKPIIKEHILANAGPFTNELLNMLPNLKDLCIIRSEPWGIPVPGYPGKTFYVWFDALFNYLSVAIRNRINWQETNIIHIIGKDIIKFHCIYWIALLIALGLKLPKFLITGWILSSGEKISKRLGHVLDINSFSRDTHRLFMCMQDLSVDKSLQSSHLTYYQNGICNTISRLIGIIRIHRDPHYDIASIKHARLNLIKNDGVMKFFESVNKYITSYEIWNNPKYAGAAMIFAKHYVKRYAFILKDLNQWFINNIQISFNKVVIKQQHNLVFDAIIQAYNSPSNDY